MSFKAIKTTDAELAKRKAKVSKAIYPPIVKFFGEIKEGEHFYVPVQGKDKNAAKFAANVRSHINNKKECEVSLIEGNDTEIMVRKIAKVSK